MAFGTSMKFKSLPKEGEALSIIMRPPTKNEAATVALGISNGIVNQYTNTNRSVSVEMELDFFQKEESKNSAFWIIAVAENDTDNIGRAIGVTSIDNIKDGRGGSGCIIFDMDMWGKGIASACHRARCYYAFYRLGLRAIDSSVAYPNDGSYKALIGVGYAKIGTYYGRHFTGGKWHHLHALTWVNPSEYKWAEFWCDNKPPKKFVKARKKAEAAIEWASENVSFI